jgi:hypothetical protein
MMIHNEKDYKTTLKRISRFQKQVENLREVEKIPENYHLSGSGFLAELDRMNLEVREYLWSHPSQFSEDRRTA